MIHVLLCGGSGARLWPLSREIEPKPFIHLFDENSLFQKNYLGNKALSSQTIIVCNLDHQFIAERQLESFGDKNIRYILEPKGRNTAAALALALHSVSPEEIVLVTPSDHHIEYAEPYFHAIQRAHEIATDGHIVLFGITPHKPETGYGYIEAVEEEVTQFHEKPSLELALKYLTRGHYYWNSGMLCFRAKTLIDAMKIHAEEILHTTQIAYTRAVGVTRSDQPIKIALEDMEKIPSLSIDHALLEKMAGLKMVRCEFRWSDLGSFDAMFSHLEKDDLGNALDIDSFYGINAKNNLVIGDRRIIAAIDVEELVIIDTKDALLIAKVGSTQKVKEIVHQLKSSGTDACIVHSRELRPWGYFTVLETSEKHKVKRIVVFPGMRLSLQKHQHRHEHWVIIAGSARVTVGDQEKIMYPNQMVYIPLGEIHRIDNIGCDDLVFIEVQYGEYVGEDDLIRIEDDFGRLETARR